MQLPTAPTSLHPAKSSHPLQKIRNLYAVAALIGNGVLLVKAPLWALTYALPASILGFLILQLLVERTLRKGLLQILKQVRGSGTELARQIDTNNRNSQLIREISEYLCSNTRTDEVVSSVMHIMEQKLDFDRGMILLADKDANHLEARGVYGCGIEHSRIFNEASFNLNNPRSRNPFVVSFRRKKPILVNNVDEILEELTPSSQSFIKALGIASFIISPIVLEGKVVGVLGVDNRKQGRPLLQEDVNLLLGIAPVIAISVHNAQLLEARQTQFDSTLHVLAESIDARDSLTAGHSRKVAEYAEGIAEEMQLPEAFRRMLRTAALLHDYGKIAIPDNILKKEGPLSDDERAIINTHPARTKQILEKIAFHGIYREIPHIVLSHHERWDGTGYPNALQGEEIPLAARIIAVADYYEAITAKRHYREPMLLVEALHILESEAGGHFDPRVLTAFLGYLEKTNLGKGEARQKGMRRVRVPRSAYRTEVSAKIDHRIFAGFSADISCGGLFFATREVQDISPETEIAITFELPIEKRLAQLRGRVAWVNSGLPRPAARLPQGFGVAFEEVGDEIREAIESYIERRTGSWMREPDTLRPMAS